MEKKRGGKYGRGRRSERGSGRVGHEYLKWLITLLLVCRQTSRHEVSQLDCTEKLLYLLQYSSTESKQ